MCFRVIYITLQSAILLIVNKTTNIKYVSLINSLIHMTEV
jgi:hypothetical protein